MLRLELHLTVMRKAKPLHISKDRLDMLGSTARTVNILNAKAKLTAKSTRKFMGT
jgi:antitoxin component HigA of HigAB toxin-antitoxin module